MSRFGFAVGILGLVCGLGAAAAGGKVVDLDGYKAEVPAGWKAADIPEGLKKFRLYQFNIGEKDKAEVIISPPFGGGVAQNIERWKGQFSGQGAKAEVSKLEVGGVPVTYLDASGTYKPPAFSANAKSEPKENYRMLGAIFDSANGPFFIRFVGPAVTVSENKQAFDQWLKSFKK